MHRDIQCRVKLLIDIFDIFFFIGGFRYFVPADCTFHAIGTHWNLPPKFYTVDLISDHQQDVGRQSTMDGDNAVFRWLDPLERQLQ